ncbi:MAG: hypothetical protein HS132_16460 [Planctomycetia bacterium]|nr:hypothetical protein [Planctomycetia bacterium]
MYAEYGAIGIEALSRGQKSCIFRERLVGYSRY